MNQKCSFNTMTGKLDCLRLNMTGVQPRAKVCTVDNACAAGTLCGCLGPGNTVCTCRKYCRADGECGMGAACEFGIVSGLQFRLCSDACELFSTTCEAGADCKIYTDNRKVCLPSGTRVAGASCAKSTECAASLACHPSFGQCRAMCNAAHPCAAGSTCSTAGFCETGAGGAGGTGGTGGGGAGGMGFEAMVSESILSVPVP
jgi:hypothetical protein